MAAGTYPLVLEYFDDNTDDKLAVRTETITLKPTSYSRTQTLAAQPVELGTTTATYTIDLLAPTPALNTAKTMALRQKADVALAWVSVVSGDTSATLTFDASS